ncbi:DeoR/GlpR family DNA-binding transcription regulator [Vibrio sp. FNV 38]|nr:DeoR/GlpR family DNA-binding transcription regulator [Vibrio sp. FNV 38]
MNTLIFLFFMPQHRRQQIIALLHERGTLSTAELAQHFTLTPQTICRDLNVLCQQGQTKRTHGGISLITSMENVHYAGRMGTNLAVKNKIAKVAAPHILAEQTVFLGYGSTVTQLAKFIDKDMPLKVITNNLDAALALDGTRCDVWIAGGQLKHKHRSTAGMSSAYFMNDFRADIGFCGVGGIDSYGNLMEFNYDEAELSKIMIRNAKKSYILADKTKIKRNASVCFSTLASVDYLVTDGEDERIIQLCKQQETTLLRV